MTSDEIKNALEDARSEKGWIKEVAFQLAKLNEARNLFLTLDDFAERYLEPKIAELTAEVVTKRRKA